MTFGRIAVRSLSLCFLLVLLVSPSRAVPETYGNYFQRGQTWVIGNPLIQAAFQLTADGRFQYRWIRDIAAGRSWRVSDPNPSSPINLTIDGIALNEDTSYSVVSYSFDPISTPAQGTRLSIVLSTALASGQIRLDAEVYSGQPFLRYRTSYTNTGPSDSYVTQADMLSWKFEDAGESFRDFFVAQWKMWRAANFEPYETDISQHDGPVEMYTGAYADHTAWRAVRDSHDHGLICAWEFDGRAHAHVEHAHDSELLKLDARISDLNHRVSHGRTFRVPEAFIGVFHGDWDEAGYRTQRFAESVLAFPMPEPDKFPYVMFDTWGYNQHIDERLAMEAADKAANAGAEVFILNLG